MKRVEAVIMTYKPDERLKAIVSRLKAQTIRPERILIVNTLNGGGSSHALEYVRQQEAVTVIDIEKAEFDHGASRDKAMQLCSGSDYVLMLTQDALPKNTRLIEKLLAALEADADTNAVAYARQEPDKNCNIIEQYTRNFNYPDEPHSGLELAAETNNGIKAIFCSNVCAMYNRSLYDEIGGFPLHAIFNEDMVFAGKALKADKDVIYEPEAVVIHSHNYSGVQYFRRYFDLGVSHREFAYILGDYHSQDEGIELVRDTAEYLMRRKEYLMLLLLVFHSGCKFLGYHLGKNYRKLPQKLLKSCTMNKEYWDRYEK